MNFYKQETSYSCVPACLRMVLSSFGCYISEKDLRERCDCIALGTDALKAVDAARSLEFKETRKTNLLLDDLQLQLELSVFPIVYINLKPISGENSQHAVVVVGIEEEIVCVYDPLVGKREFPRTNFEEPFRAMRELVILVRP